MPAKMVLVHTFPPAQLGLHVSPDGSGTYAVAAPHATRVWLCVDRDGREVRYPLAMDANGVHSGRVEGLTEGSRYGLRVKGPWDPDSGWTFTPNVLLADPFACGLSMPAELGPWAFAHRVRKDLSPSVPHLPIEGRGFEDGFASVVVHPDPTRGGASSRPLVPWEKTVVYEAHVKGFTAQHPGIPEELRGTYAGLGRPEVTSYLKGLGVTTLELLPIHAFADEPHLVRKSLTNYWGYNTVSFFAPHAPYATHAANESGASAVLAEVQDMVRALHREGIEVILDVVYNHTAEGDENGPTFCWRGLDPEEYYWRDEGRLVNVTGTGNTLDPRSRHTRDMILASLRFWASVVGVDGFRFDLAATLGRRSEGFVPDAPLLATIQADPVLRGLKLIAEPWDVGPGGWNTGRFEAPFAEWNDSFRDTVRSTWLGTLAPGAPRHGMAGLATRIAGSEDLFAGRSPLASLNFVTAHDGFTLHDLTTYNRKHNEANGEEGRDGTDDNRSYNFGTEGEDRALDERRARVERSLLTTLLFSAGVPMLTAGDEARRTQGGNNNAYCQDSPVSYMPWELDGLSARNVAFVREALALRTHLAPVFADGFFSPAALGVRKAGSLGWLRPDGSPMNDEAWNDPELRHLTAVFAHPDRPFALVLNTGQDPCVFHLGGAGWLGDSMHLSLDSSLGKAVLESTSGTLELPGHTAAVLTTSFPASPRTVEASLTPGQESR